LEAVPGAVVAPDQRYQLSDRERLPFVPDQRGEQELPRVAEVNGPSADSDLALVSALVGEVDVQGAVVEGGLGFEALGCRRGLRAADSAVMGPTPS